MKIQEIKIDSLIPYEYNNKKHDETQINRLANSIKEFWFIQPLVIDKNNIVIIWHWRLEWAKKIVIENCSLRESWNTDRRTSEKIEDSR